MTTPNVSGNGEVRKRGIRALSALSGNRGKSGHPLAVLSATYPLGAPITLARQTYSLEGVVRLDTTYR
jgi:hypothetical protein